MIEYQIVNVRPNLSAGHLFSIAFTVLAVDGELRESADFNTPASLPDRVKPYTEAEFLELAGRIAYANQIYSDLTARIKAKRAALSLPAPAPVVAAASPAERRAAWVKSVDDVVAGINDRFTRFTLAYTQREAAAVAYKASGYTIDPTEWITRFADNVKVSYPVATGIILSQAVKLRKAVMDLDNLRMDKYLIDSAATIELAEIEYRRIVSAANDIARTL